MSTRLDPHPKLRVRLKSLVKSRGKMYTKFVLLDNKFCFTCCELDLKHCKAPKYYDQDCRKLVPKIV